MRVSLRADNSEMDVQVTGADDSVSVGELFEAAGLGASDDPVDIDGRRCAPSTPLSAVAPPDGAILVRRAVSPGDYTPITDGGAVARLISVAGPGTGRATDLEPGTWDLCIVSDPIPTADRDEGQGAGDGSVEVNGGPADPGTAVVRLDVSVDGSVRVASIGDGPVLVDGFPADEALRVGRWIAARDSVFRVGPATARTPSPAMVGGGRTVFVRAPRVRETDDVDGVVAPSLPAEPRAPEPLSWLVLVLPLPVAVFMAYFFSPFFLMFSLLSPITALGRTWDAKRRRRKVMAGNRATIDRELIEFMDQLDRRAAVAAEIRRTARPDLAQLAEIARTGDPSLWRSRSTHDDFLRPVIGVGPVSWEPTIVGDLPTPEHEAAVGQASILPMSPVAVDLFDGIALGIVGPPEARRAIAATVISHLAVEHGPGDVALAALLTERSAMRWDQLKWLPHLVDESGSLRIATDPDGAEQLAARTLPEPERQAFLAADRSVIETPMPVFLVDADDVVAGGVRPLAARMPSQPGRAIVLADTVEQLPSFCTSYGVIDPVTGLVDLVDVGSGTLTPGIVGAFADRATVTGICRSLARFVDPDSPAGAASLPDHAMLTEILGIEPKAGDLRDRWQDPPPGCLSMLGMAEDGPLDIELLRDGPHALVAGTTGAGKSELLRTMIVSLAARYGPDRVTFVLVDFKGGGAFDVFADLPHNVGVVTDLDEHLSARALRCLQAELKYREHRLRDLGVSDLVAVPPDAEPLPRLLIVVDEFATLAAELPDFMTSLIDVAQRGRSLGIHMVLATQRPTGVVDGKIRANTNLRVALRVQDDGDSMDVIGSKSAAEIDRRHPGRAFARFGASELVGFQTALVSVSTGDRQGPTLRLEPFELLDLGDRGDGPRFDGPGPDDLTRYVAAASTAADQLGLPPPRVPWPDPLPTELAAESLLAAAAGSPDPASADRRSPDPNGERPWSAPFGLVDLPDEQRQATAWWTPADGNAVFYGIEPGAAATAVATIVLGLAKRNDADSFHLYTLDFAGSLAALRQLPHSGGYVNADDDERLMRCLQLLEDELDRRRRLVEAAQVERVDHAADLGEPTPLIAVAIANYGGVLELFEELGELGAPNRLAQIVRDGPALGLFVFIASSSERDVPNRVGQQIEAKFIMRMADPSAYLMFGLKTKDVPDLVAGRAIDARSKLELQVARFCAGDLRRAVETNVWEPGQRGPRPVPVLGDEIGFEQIADAAGFDERGWLMPVGLATDDLTPVTLSLRVGRHAVVTGPSGAGKTTALQTIAAAARAGDPKAVIAVAASRPDEWAGLVASLDLTTLDHLLAPETDMAPGQRVLLIIDGFENLSLPEPELEITASRPLDGMHLVVGGRPDSFRTPPTWLRAVMSHRTGIAVNAAPDHGDVFRCRFPTQKGPMVPGRGQVVVEGQAVGAQLALPPPPLPPPRAPQPATDRSALGTDPSAACG